MRKQSRIATFYRTQPVPCCHGVALKPLVFTSCPSHNKRVYRAQLLLKLRGVKPAIVAHPACKDRANPAGDFFQFQIVTTMQSPAPHTAPHFLGGLLANRWNECDEALALAIDSLSWTKCVPKKVERSLGMFPRPIGVLAVNNLGLLRVQL